jgi:hypothetical protein
VVGKSGSFRLQIGYPESANRLNDISRNRAQQPAARRCFLDLFLALWQRGEHVYIHDPVETSKAAPDTCFYCKTGAATAWQSGPEGIFRPSRLIDSNA